MRVQINGQEKELTESKTLFDLVNEFAQHNKRVIAEVNGEIIKNPRWNEIQINDGDTIELVSFVGGG